MILTELEQRVDLKRKSLRKLSEPELADLITTAQAQYSQGLAASRCGEEEVARSHYQKAFGMLPTHAEALDNYAIGLVEELRFADAVPFLEQSAYAEPSSPLAFLYLTKCYQETGQPRLAVMCIEYLKNNWPDKSPVIDWSHLGQPQPKQPSLAPPFSEGQVWKFAERASDDASRVWIRLVEMAEAGPFVHISVLLDSPSEQHDRLFVSHLPYAPDGLLASNLIVTDERQQWDLPDDHFGEGFVEWGRAFQAGNAGVFTASVAEVVGTIVQQMNGQ